MSVLASKPRVACSCIQIDFHMISRMRLCALSIQRQVCGRASEDLSRKTVLYYTGACSVLMLGVAYAGVPLYRIYCSKTGSGTNAADTRITSSDRIPFMRPVRNRPVTVEFSADTYSHMAWNFKPSQRHLKIVPGETALAFYTAKNPTNKPIVGIATYTILPIEASKYFNKIQVDLPVFFFLDPEFDDDPVLMRVNKITLHYTFFEAKREKMMIPGISTPLREEVS